MTPRLWGALDMHSPDVTFGKTEMRGTEEDSFLHAVMGRDSLTARRSKFNSYCKSAYCSLDMRIFERHHIVVQTGNYVYPIVVAIDR